MECTVRWTGAGMSLLAETGSNHVLVMDGAPEGGGRNLAPRPMETVLAGTGGCTAYDVVVILKKSGQDVTGCELRLEAERAELAQLAPREGEWETLGTEHGRLANAASLLEGAQAAVDALSEADGALAPQLAEIGRAHV